MSKYKELLSQRGELESAIAQARKSEAGEAIANIKALIVQFDILPEDLFDNVSGGGAGKKARSSTSKGRKVAAKYLCPVTGATWTGRGKAPVWIRDAEDKNVFLIATPAEATDETEAAE